MPPVESKQVKEAVDELVKLYVSKSGSFKKADGKTLAVSLSEVDELVEKKLALDEKLLYLGERTISRLGCFGCHRSLASRTPSRSGPRSTTGASSCRPGSISGTSRST